MPSLASGTPWLTRVRVDRKAFDKAVTANKAVRVLHPSGSWKVVKNPEALPQTMDTSFVAGR